MNNNPNSEIELDAFLDQAIHNKLYSSQKRLRYYLSEFFKNVPLEGAKYLEIGSGGGLMCLYAAVMNAESVVGLEPNSDGSTGQKEMAFGLIKEVLDLQQITILPIEFQKFDDKESDYSTCVLHNTVNHLNEKAYMNLHNSSDSINIYKDLFNKIHTLLKPGGHLLIADASPNNFYPLLRLRNPFGTNMDWHLHQPPSILVNLLSDVGFGNPKIKWLGPNRFRFFNRLLSNKVASFFWTSHYFIHMIRE